MTSTCVNVAACSYFFCFSVHVASDMESVVMA
jgi:hypothetical protein